VNALVRDKSKGAQSIDSVVLGLLEQARKEKKPLPVSAWVDAVAGLVGPAERDAFAKTIDQGQEVALPGTVLGHCYRQGTGEYVDFNLGFDDTATREGKSGEVLGFVAGGPAAKAGLKAGDVVTETEYRVGHSEVPVKLTVKRGNDTVRISYLPAGARHKGPIWTRVGGTPDEKCTDAW
jgi:predicted metalloprotease with PDZ domain